MPRENLLEAADQLSTAADACDDEAAAATLRDLAGQLEGLAERDQPPDHGRLARIQRHAAELAGDCSPPARTAIETADDHVNAFRETIEGV